MQTYERWTQDDHVTDDALLKHFGNLVHWLARRAARSYSLSAEDIEDISQSLFLKLVATPADKRPFEGYCLMVLNNALRDELHEVVGSGSTPDRIWNRHGTVGYDEATAALSPGDDISDPLEYISPALNPETSMVDSLALNTALLTLSDRERVCLDLERPTSDIAAELGITHQYISVIRKRAYRKLRQKLTSQK